ncbi:MAG TPA: hypothetical protein VFU38_04290, partial [Candidatus Krumholzibacteria bacterium]|nr:hypothetical protein [Candidatus Krumholzibacteria bacterium]
RSLSDSDLLSRVRGIAVRERTLTLFLLLHLNEIERRNLHLKQGYSSMFDYCTSCLGYSETAAIRRIRTARCVARFPIVFELLKANEVNLSTITRISGVIAEDNHEVLLARIRGKTHREVEAIVAEYHPRALLRDVVKPIAVRVPVATLPVPGSNSTSTTEVTGPSATELLPQTSTSTTPDSAGEPMRDACEGSAYRRIGGDFHPGHEGFTIEQRVRFTFAASPGFQQKVDRVKSLAWHRLRGDLSLEHVFEVALDCYIEKHDPRSRQKRREKRKRRDAG